MAFQYTFRADDISTWDVDTRDLVENRDRELELYASTIDSSFLNLNADNLTSGTVPSSRVTGSYAGITQVGTLSAGNTSYSIGDTGPSGGKVFITPSTSGNTTDLYFEVAPVSVQVQRYWAQFTPVWYNSTSVPLAQFDTIGTGKTNTVAIVNQGNTDPNVSAAKYCDDFTYGGFSDWFLPSRDELAQIYTNRVALGNNFGLGYFWSSSEAGFDAAWVRYFTNGTETNIAKANNLYVRPVRSFSATGLNIHGSTVVRTAAAQDGVILTGRAGGTSNYAVNILPTTLSASRTVTLPNATGTMITTGNLSDITSVGTLASGSIPASLLTGTTLPATIVTSSLTSVGTLTGLTTTGQVTMSRGALGTTAGNEISFINPNATTSNNDYLDTRLIRNSNGTTWTTAVWRMGRLVDATRMGFIQFGDGAGAQDVRLGVGTTTYGTINTSGLFVTNEIYATSNIRISTAGANFVAQSPATGTGNAAQWVSIFGLYILYRNTSTRNDKENFQPLNGVVTPNMIDDIEISLWNRKGATGFPEIGPMAEDMDDVSPFLSIRGMGCDEEGNIVPTAPSGINQNSWLSLLTLGIQDLRKRVEQLETT